MLWSRVLFVFLMGFLACTTQDPAPEPNPGQGTEHGSNAPPVARVGPDQSALVGQRIELDGTASSDPDADAQLSFAWEFLAAPEPRPAIENANQARAAFVPTTSGTHQLRLTVSDGALHHSATLTIVVAPREEPEGLAANAGADATVSLGQLVTLDGSGSTGPAGVTLAHAWSFVRLPPGSTAQLSNPTLVNPTFVADVGGAYEVRLVVRGMEDGQLRESPPDSVTITGASNHVPMASIGGNTQVIVGQELTLDGAASTDLDGDPLSYTWRLVSRPPDSASVLNLATTAAPTFTPDRVGGYLVELVVSDGTASSLPARSLLVASLPTTTRPTAHAGPDTAGATTGQTVVLSGAGSSDPGGRLLTYQWSLVSRPPASQAMIINPLLRDAALIPDVVGTYALALVVVANGESSLPDFVDITVDNTPPTADAGNGGRVRVGSAVALDGRGSSDGENDSLTYRWRVTQRPAGASAEVVPAADAQPTLTPDVAGRFVVELVVSDGRVNSLPSRVEIDAFVPGAPVANAGEDRIVRVGQTVQLNGMGSMDPSGAGLGYAWEVVASPSGSSAALTGAQTATPSLVADRAGTYEVGLVVTAGQDPSPQDVVRIHADTPPMARIEALPSRVQVGTLIFLDGTGSSDADGDQISFQWTLTGPMGAGAFLDPTATASRPSFIPHLPGIYHATLVVNDGHFDSETIGVTVEAADQVVNRAPTAHAGADVLAVPARTLVTLDGTASFDPEGDALTYRWQFVSLPPGAQEPTLTSANVANPGFYPTETGTYELALVVSDGRLSSAPDTLRVTALNVAPVANAGPDATIPVQRLVTLDGRASSDPNGDLLTYRWEIVSSPSGSTPLLTGALLRDSALFVDLPGDYELSLQVNDGSMDSAVDTVVLTAVTDQPIADAGPDQGVSTPARVQLDGTGSTDPRPGAPPLRYAWRFVSIPAGAVEPLLSSPEVARPTFDVFTTGVYQLALVVTDGAGVTSQPDTVDIIVKTPPVANAGPDVAAIAGASCYRPMLGAPLTAGGSVDPRALPATYRWELTQVPAGSRLVGATSNATTFQFNPDVPGSYAAVLTVTDAFGDSDTDSVALTAELPELLLLDGDSQTATVGQTLADPLRVRVRSPSGLLVGFNCASVRFSTTGGGTFNSGSVAYPVVATNGEGIVSVTAHLGPLTGSQAFQATLLSSAAAPVEFRATAVAGAPTLVIVETPERTQAGQTAMWRGQLTDTYGNALTESETTGTLTAGGSATFAETASVGTVLSGGGTSQLVIATDHGAFAIGVNDATAETVQLGFTDTSFGGLRVLTRRTVLDEDFEVGPGAFTSSPASPYYGRTADDDWAWGTPTVVGPAAAHSGTRLWGTSLDGFYSVNADADLWVPVDLSSAATGVPRSALVTFWHYEEMNNRRCTDPSAAPDGALASFLAGYTNPYGELLKPGPGAPEGRYNLDTCAGSTYGCVTGWSCMRGTWVQSEFDLSSRAGSQQTLRWRLRNTSATLARAPGFYVDDVKVTVLSATGPTVRFTSGQGTRVAMPDPPAVPRSNAMRLDLAVVDADGNVVTTDSTSTWTVRVDGNATFPYASAGQLVSGAGTNTVVVTAEEGRVRLAVQDAVRERVHFSLSNGQPDTMDVSATATGVFTDLPQAICIVGGDLQSDVVDRTLPNPVVARVVDRPGCPPAADAFGISTRVQWSITSGAGSVAAERSQSDDTGVATAQWRLGTRTNTAHHLQAQATDYPLLKATAVAIAVPDLAARLVFMPPTTTRAPGTTIVTAQVQDRFTNVVTSDNSTTFTAWVTGSATFGSAAGGTILSADGNTIVGQVQAGQLAVQLSDTLRETVDLYAFDTHDTGLAMPSAAFDQVLPAQPLRCNTGAVEEKAVNTFTFDIPKSGQDAALEVQVNAYFSSNSSIAVLAEGPEGIPLGTLFTSAYGYSCGLRTANLTIPGAVLGALTGDGVLTVVTRAGDNVLCSCGGGATIGARLAVVPTRAVFN